MEQQGKILSYVVRANSLNGIGLLVERSLDHDGVTRTSSTIDVGVIDDMRQKARQLASSSGVAFGEVDVQKMKQLKRKLEDSKHVII